MIHYKVINEQWKKDGLNGLVQLLLVMDGGKHVRHVVDSLVSRFIELQSENKVI